MKLDITWTITAVIALSSIISPIIVSILNNMHDTKIRKLELFSKAQQEALSEFSKNVIYNFGTQHLKIDFYKALTNLYPYFQIDENLSNKLIEHKQSDIKEYQKDVLKFINKLSKQIKYK